jgi:hypothetical protein
MVIDAKDRFLARMGATMLAAGKTDSSEQFKQRFADVEKEDKEKAKQHMTELRQALPSLLNW